ncbi:MarR family transcriptional regulator [Lachnospiraceae bacterium MD1]|uniref:MarR family transcriptional regulator n=1 Tax=Variimorphobacter saccharofermentans TaxID=2755051 RepID=A0A839K3W6_9FIRM|nr:MarR family transcriptional regulator [Variimorphobacter saccharofermentans]MBB2184300.1 MarR family transcriptional regulator [Variimorphobacter saccharofermentans]
MSKTNGGFLISKIKQLQDRIFGSLLRQYGIDEFNGAQGRILFVLWQEDNLPIVELSRRTSLAKTTLTSMLDRMENKGILIRSFDTADRRQIRILLTDKAKALNEQYNQVSEEMNQLFYKDFEEPEITMFEQYLQRILKNLEEEDKHE